MVEPRRRDARAAAALDAGARAARASRSIGAGDGEGAEQVLLELIGDARPEQRDLRAARPRLQGSLGARRAKRASFLAPGPARQGDRGLSAGLRGRLARRLSGHQRGDADGAAHAARPAPSRAAAGRRATRSSAGSRRARRTTGTTRRCSSSRFSRRTRRARPPRSAMRWRRSASPGSPRRPRAICASFARRARRATKRCHGPPRSRRSSTVRRKRSEPRFVRYRGSTRPSIFLTACICLPFRPR